MADEPGADARTPCPLPGEGAAPGSEPTPRTVHLDVTDASRGLRPATLAVTAGRPPHAPDAPLNEPVAFASAYHAGGPIAYARDGNRSWSALEDAIGALEGGSALAFASGMAAIAAVFYPLALGAPVRAPPPASHGPPVPVP